MTEKKIKKETNEKRVEKETEEKKIENIDEDLVRELEQKLEAHMLGFRKLEKIDIENIHYLFKKMI